MYEMQHPVIGFGIVYADELIFCEAVMKDNHYDVLFDGKFVASIANNDEWEWMQEFGTILPDTVIAEIGLKIESNYR